MEVKRSSRGVYRIEYHFVWISRYRHAVLEGDIAKRLRALIIEESVIYHPEWETIRLAVEPDHVHWLMSAPPKYAPSEIMRITKSNTSRKLMEEFPGLREHFYWGATLWSDGFFVSTVGPVSEAVIKHYIEYQRRADARQQRLNFG